MEVGHSLFFLIAIIAAAKVAGEVSEYLGAPAIIGELLAGVVLGSVGMRSAAEDPAIVFIASIGIILLLFEVGLGSQLDEFLKAGKSATLVAVIGVALPFVAGYFAAFALSGDYRQALFLGAILTATSVGVTARVLSDLGRTASPETRIILGAAVIDDILGLLILSIVVGIVATGVFRVTDIVIAVVVAVLFLVGSLWIGIRFAGRLIEWARRLKTRGVLVTFAFLFCITLAYVAETLGLAEIIGAFAAGLVLETTDDRIKIQRQIKPLADIFVPVFFVVVGLQVNLAALNPFGPSGWGVLTTGMILLVLAVIGKLAAGLGVVERGVSRIAVGVGMIPRGEVGLIFASIGLREGVLTSGLYAAVIFVVFFSTLITPPWLKMVFRRAAP